MLQGKTWSVLLHRLILLLAVAAIVPACGGGSSGGSGGAPAAGGGLPIGPSPGGAPASTPGAGTGTPGATGTTWRGPTPTNQGLNDVDYGPSIGGIVGYAVGDFGVILRTDDGGLTWSAQTSGTTVDLVALSVIDANNVIAIGNDTVYDALSGFWHHTVLITDDGGATWSAANSPNTTFSENLVDVKFVTPLLGWAISYNNDLLKTDDGGVTWTEYGTPVSSLYSLDAYVAPNGEEVVVIGSSGYFARSNDGGSSFAFTTYFASYVSYLYAYDIKITVPFSTAMTPLPTAPYEETIVVVGQDPWGNNQHIQRSTNGGTTFSGTTLPPNRQPYNSVAFLNATDGWAVGDPIDDTVNNVWLHNVLATTDGGVTWTPLDFGNTGDLYISLNGVTVYDSTNLLIVGDLGTILHYDGLDLTVVNLGIVTDLADVDMVSATEAWAVGANGVILRTSSGGASWAAQVSGTNDDLQAISAVSTTTAFAVGGKGKIFRTTNGGTTWTTLTSPANQNLNDVDFVNANFGVAVGAFGTIIRTTDGGATWTNETDAAVMDKHLKAVDMVDTARGFAMGQQGNILETSDGGQTWFAVNTVPTNGQLSGISFTGWQLGYLLGGGVWKTVDGGNTWSSLTLPANTGGPTAIKFIDDFHGYITTDEGEVLMTIDGGSSWTVLSQETNMPLNGVDFFNVTTGIAVGEAGSIVSAP